MAEPLNSVLFLSMYPLDVLDRAPRVRSYHLWRELDRLVPTTLVAGRRGKRVLKMLTLAATGRLFRFAAVYVETSTASAAPADLLALALLRLLGKPIFIYIRDAYQLFPSEFPPRTIRRKVSYWGWRVSVGAYKHVAARLLFPTDALAALFGLEDGRWDLLPPAGSPLVAAARHSGAPRVGYVGDLTPEIVDLLRDTLRRVRQSCAPRATCTIVSSRRDWESFPSLDSEDWCEHRQASRDQLVAALWDVDTCLVPRPARGYNALTLPVKLFDYMSLAKAVITTNLPAVAAIVEGESVGIVSRDDPESLAQAVCHLFDHPGDAKRYQLNALEAVRTRHSWRDRAERLLGMMMEAGEGAAVAPGGREPR